MVGRSIISTALLPVAVKLPQGLISMTSPLLSVKFLFEAFSMERLATIFDELALKGLTSVGYPTYIKRQIRFSEAIRGLLTIERRPSM